MKISAPIHEFLCGYAEENPVRCHMPGGKSNPFDITEIEGADSLFESCGIIKESEDIAAGLFGAEKTLFSCGGSTLSIQTMLGIAKSCNLAKNRVAASRYCHKSLISAAVLLGLEIDWIMPDSFLSCKVTAAAVREKITSDTLCVFVQSIDYYGGECDIAGISEVCKKRGVPLLVDNAHGAYLVFTSRHPLALGADMTADSAHKTLPCLTGGAYLHIGEKAPKEYLSAAKDTMSLFGSSSPSYLILDSLDLCNLHIYGERERAERVFEGVRALKSGLKALGYSVRQSDQLRVTIDACAYGYSGGELSGLFRERGIVCEYSDEKYLVMLFSTGQNLKDFDRILEAAKSIPPKKEKTIAAFSGVLPPCEMPPRDALFSPSEEIETVKAEGRICGGIHCPCPPCVPVVMPGERYTKEGIEMLLAYGVKRVKAVI